MLRVGCKSVFEVWEMLSVVYATVANNVDREKAIGEIGQNSFDDSSLVDGGSHRDCIVSWNKHEIAEGGGADEFALYIVVECDGALRRRKKRPS